LDTVQFRRKPVDPRKLSCRSRNSSRFAEFGCARNRQCGVQQFCLRMLSIALQHKEVIMQRIFVAVLITSFSIGTAMAQSCASKAVSKEGKPLTGAAKTSFIKKCKEDACESKAVSKDGKPLSGAAKTSFMKKCERAA
jgi:hypothetical protein